MHRCNAYLAPLMLHLSMQPTARDKGGEERDIGKPCSALRSCTASSCISLLSCSIAARSLQSGMEECKRGSLLLQSDLCCCAASSCISLLSCSIQHAAYNQGCRRARESCRQGWGIDNYLPAPVQETTRAQVSLTCTTRPILTFQPLPPPATRPSESQVAIVMHLHNLRILIAQPSYPNLNANYTPAHPVLPSHHTHL